jgi:WD40 repeat protein
MLLVATLDSTIRSLDAENGNLFQSYKGHKSSSYRSKVCFGPKESTVIFGDEEGKVWTWDVESVRHNFHIALVETDLRVNIFRLKFFQRLKLTIERFYGPLDILPINR